MKNIGLIVGGGVGPEVAEVFRKALGYYCPSGVDIVECLHHSKSYTETKTWDYKKVSSSVLDDAKKLQAFYEDFYKNGGRCIFRSPVNAESLYMLRKELQVVKFIPLKINHRNILMVRDQIQGFYANDNYKVQKNEITFSGSFTKEKLRSVFVYAIEEAQKVLRDGYDIWLVYKHHLFSNVMETWVNEFKLGGNLTQHIYVAQPGSGNVKLMEYIEHGKKDLLLIMGNEIGDIIHEDFLGRVEGESRETSIAKNICLSPKVSGLIEYQTVHGSADDIAKKGKFNPLATIRAAATIAQKEIGKKSIINEVENKIRKAIQRGHLNKKLEVKTNTSETVDFLLTD